MEQKPKCPDCGGSILRSLISTDTAYRYECVSMDCLKNFTVPKEGFGPSPLLATGRKEEAQVPKTKNEFDCRKCGESCENGRSRGQHERYCTKTKAGNSGRRKMPVLPKRNDYKGPDEKESITGNILAMLKDKREQRIAELTAGDLTLAEIDGLIGKIEE